MHFSCCFRNSGEDCDVPEFSTSDIGDAGFSYRMHWESGPIRIDGWRVLQSQRSDLSFLVDEVSKRLCCGHSLEPMCDPASVVCHVRCATLETVEGLTFVCLDDERRYLCGFTDSLRVQIASVAQCHCEVVSRVVTESWHLELNYSISRRFRWLGGSNLNVMQRTVGVQVGACKTLTPRSQRHARDTSRGCDRIGSRGLQPMLEDVEVQLARRASTNEA